MSWHVLRGQADGVTNADGLTTIGCTIGSGAAKRQVRTLYYPPGWMETNPDPHMLVDAGLSRTLVRIVGNRPNLVAQLGNIGRGYLEAGPPWICLGIASKGGKKGGEKGYAVLASPLRRVAQADLPNNLRGLGQLLVRFDSRRGVFVATANERSKRTRGDRRNRRNRRKKGKRAKPEERLFLPLAMDDLAGPWFEITGGAPVPNPG